ncbi:MAG: polysaccharide pyruvyl transferase family protein, partial [Verrucomicrobia bacterium]|nr:polysaccharide pyruvyl transferase family protein [Verrucomicrobiota bacterium]
SETFLRDKIHARRHFLLVGHAGSHNRGCEALVRTTAQMLRSVYPDAHITLASGCPEHDDVLLEIPNLEIIPAETCHPRACQPGAAPVIKTSRSVIRRGVKGLLPYGLVRWLQQRSVAAGKRRGPSPGVAADYGYLNVLKPAMLRADLVISIGGDLFIEDYGLPLLHIETLEYAQQLGRRTMLWAASTWPLKTPWIEARLQQMLSQCDLITVRDETSRRYLSTLVAEKRIDLVADGAFLMEPARSARVQLPWSIGTPTLAFNGTPLLTYFLGPNRGHAVVQAFVQFLRGGIDTGRFKAVLVPHDAHPHPREWDFLYELAQMVDRPDAVYLPPVGLNGPETKALIGLCDTFIAMRFHPTIAGMSQSVPTLGLGYSPKFAGLHELVYGHTEFLIGYDKVTADALQEASIEQEGA